MTAFNCIRCGHENGLSAFGYGGDFKGKLTCQSCGAVHRAEMMHSALCNLELAGFDSIRLPKDVPAESEADYHEAQRCSQVAAYKGVVTLCRRSLQAAVHSKGVENKGNLKDMIDRLAQQGIISSDLANLAHGIRFFGNYGAHPQDDGLKQITELEAQTTFSLTGQLLTRLFEPSADKTEHP